jgi:small-conductance mechanosensitive channel
MFSNNHSQSNRWPSTFTPAPRATAEPSPDNRMVSAVLETLGKLNKHLDAASGNGAPDARSSPVISALLQSATDSTAQNQTFSEESQQTTSSNVYSRDFAQMKEELRQEMKEELRREMREELRRDRAGLEEKLDAVQRTQDMILEMLRQEPA